MTRSLACVAVLLLTISDRVSGEQILIDFTLPPTPSVEGALFVDPRASTIGNGVFGAGPQLTYNSTSGGVSITAPPLLGPPDEFGARREYRPIGITLASSDLRVGDASLPDVTIFNRNPALAILEITLIPLGQTGAIDPAPLTEETPSFVTIPDGSQSLNISESELELFPSSRGFGGAEVVFDRLLPTDLDRSVLTLPEDLLLPDGLAQFQGIVDGAPIETLLPDVYAVVDYSLVGFSFSSPTTVPRSFRLLALPQSVPEPSTGWWMIAGVTVAVLLPRRFAPCVA